MSHRFPYRWRMADGYPESHGHTVFSTFACGGGSTMGYKLAGFDVLGCCEIDPKIIEVYRANHSPAISYCEDIRVFRERDDLPAELFDLDVLDGSPPCSTFSMSGKRDRDWDREKAFREGQAVQRLDDLFFDFIALADRLRPKVVVAENVKGMIQGKAKGYAKEVVAGFRDAGYDVQLFLLNAAGMGVPQRRERVFFVARRRDLGWDPLRLEFNEPPIPFGECEVDEPCSDRAVWPKMRPYYEKCEPGRNMSTVSPKGPNHWFNFMKVAVDAVCPTLASAAHDKIWHYERPYALSAEQWAVCGTYPLDYDYGSVDPQYLIGMSVPPVMTAQIATEIHSQWFNRRGHGQER